MDVKLYSSSVAGSILVNKATTRISDILTGRRIAFTLVDVSVDEEAKTFMQSTSGLKTLPQLFVNGKYKGALKEVEEANEEERLADWLAE